VEGAVRRAEVALADAEAAEGRAAAAAAVATAHEEVAGGQAAAAEQVRCPGNRCKICSAIEFVHCLHDAPLHVLDAAFSTPHAVHECTTNP
jgi:hypothetical protein